VDVVIEQSFPDLFQARLRRSFLDFGGLSVAPLAALLVGYLLFVIGYKWQAGRTLARLLPFAPGKLAPWRCMAICTVVFVATFGVLVAYTNQVGYGRFKGTSPVESSLSRLSILGELSLIPYTFVAWYYMRTKAEHRGALKKRIALSLFVVMGSLQLAISTVAGMRSRVVSVILIALGARHYALRPIRTRTFLAFACFNFVVLLPALDVLRGSTEAPFSIPMIWDSVMSRTSALEGYTVTFDGLESAPRPDPLWLVVVSGLVPHVIWEGKPLSRNSDEFSLWASSDSQAQLAPTLPGELLMHFGRIGGLVAMFALGVFWRCLFEIFIGTERRRRTWGFVYITVVPTFLTTEAGFVLPYAFLVRFLAVSICMFLMVRTRGRSALAPSQ
jgi:hypothetical protein